MPQKTIMKIAGFVLAIVLLFTFSGKFVEEVDAGDIVVVQSIFGTLKVVTTPGPTWQGWGTVTHYKKSFQMFFSKFAKDGDTTDQSIKVRFNDGGHANLSGSVRIDMPLSEKEILALHTKYGSQIAIENQLVGQVITKSVYMTGPMMSSKESYAEKRNDLISFVEDQAIHGVYRTIVENIKQKDPMDTSVERTVAIVRIRLDDKGNALRQEASPIEQFNLHLYNLAINSVDYDEIVENQIKQQQQATMQVQTAIAKAKEAQQNAYTAEQEGMATAAKAKWAKEAEKAAAVTEAQKIKEVAKLTADAEVENKRGNILKGEGEAEYKRLVTQANNNVELRIDATKEVLIHAFDAMASSNWVPTYYWAGNGGGPANAQSGAMDLINLMTSRVATQFGTEMSANPTVPGSGKKK
jgi:hypothetical protein